MNNNILQKLVKFKLTGFQPPLDEGACYDLIRTVYNADFRKLNISVLELDQLDISPKLLKSVIEAGPIIDSFMVKFKKKMIETLAQSISQDLGDEIHDFICDEKEAQDEVSRKEEEVIRKQNLKSAKAKIKKAGLTKEEQSAIGTYLT